MLLFDSQSLPGLFFSNTETPDETPAQQRSQPSFKKNICAFDEPFKVTQKPVCTIISNMVFSNKIVRNNFAFKVAFQNRIRFGSFGEPPTFSLSKSKIIGTISHRGIICSSGVDQNNVYHALTMISYLKSCYAMYKCNILFNSSDMTYWKDYPIGVCTI